MSPFGKMNMQLGYCIAGIQIIKCWFFFLLLLLLLICTIIGSALPSNFPVLALNLFNHLKYYQLLSLSLPLSHFIWSSTCTMLSRNCCVGHCLQLLLMTIISTPSTWGGELNTSPVSWGYDFLWVSEEVFPTMWSSHTHIHWKPIVAWSTSYRTFVWETHLSLIAFITLFA